MTDGSGDIAANKKLQLRIWLGNTAGGFGQWSTDGTTWNSFRDKALGGMLDTRIYPAGANVNGNPGRPRTPAWGPACNNPNAAAFESVNGTTPVYLGLLHG